MKFVENKYLVIEVRLGKIKERLNFLFVFVKKKTTTQLNNIKFFCDESCISFLKN